MIHAIAPSPGPSVYATVRAAAVKSAVAPRAPSLTPPPLNVPEQAPAKLRADSLLISNLYGAALIVALAAPVVYPPFNPQGDQITPVTRLARPIPPRDATGDQVDQRV